MRAIKATDRVLDAEVPNLDSVVPTCAHDNVVVLGVKLEREDTVRVPRRDLAPAATECRRQRLGRFVVYPDLVVLASGRKDPSVIAVVDLEGGVVVRGELRNAEGGGWGGSQRRR